MYTGLIYIASDHAGYKLKKRLIRYIENELKLKVEDRGPKEYDENDDYPKYIIPAAQKAVAMNGRVIVIGGSGNGEAMAANKVKGMRCILAHSLETAELGRAHNDANGIAFGARIITEEHAMAMLKHWLETEFLGGKYERRNEEIEDFEENN
ncbi:MAG: RpiB/LacA/LacB family sugar-phosphate isomerase [bacterium]|nr:RpiB/LacA/LacB family sugar-phosphate isomerase [bacterium]